MRPHGLYRRYIAGALRPCRLWLSWTSGIATNLHHRRPSHYNAAVDGDEDLASLTVPFSRCKHRTSFRTNPSYSMSSSQTLGPCQQGRSRRSATRYPSNMAINYWRTRSKVPRMVGSLLMTRLDTTTPLLSLSYALLRVQPRTGQGKSITPLSQGHIDSVPSSPLLLSTTINASK